MSKKHKGLKAAALVDIAFALHRLADDAEARTGIVRDGAPLRDEAFRTQARANLASARRAERAL